ncbi:hypothetical protein H114_00797 [Streptomyces gancidicus BKS 13-15]|uniref:Uncharacterized protein n=1 Tax=Streptomyces gancidicus BKS 13-15 TaxID=1284664 RepID=M3EBN5_STREZ|nr:hypothetical protein [Streptomyces gancidicus]EMF31122.1 hypothetical protein H114_00797 [Streptomyces gancidicus BKS 13-15]
MMNFADVQVDTRVIITAHGQKATVLRKFMGGANHDLPVILMDVDGVGEVMRTPDQLDRIDEPAPAPKLHGTGSKNVKRFHIGGNEYHVYNSASGARGFWQVWRHEAGKAATNADCVVSGATTRKAAFEEALRILAAA